MVREQLHAQNGDAQSCEAGRTQAASNRPAPAELASDELASALLPVLIHRMNNATQMLSNLSSLARLGAAAPSGKDWLEERAEDLVQTSDSVDEIGYLLAVLASASGANLLLERRLPRGLSWMMSAVQDLLRRDGHAVASCSRPVPDQAPGVASGWELCWAVGALLLASAKREGQALLGQALLGQPLQCQPLQCQPLQWQWLQEDDSWVLVCATTAASAVEGLRSQLAARLPESSLDVRSEGWSWRVPACWLSSAGA